MSYSIPQDRWNTFIDFINQGRTKTELDPPIQNERESELFDNMAKQLAEARMKNSNAKLSHVDFEWGPVGSGYDLD